MDRIDIAAKVTQVIKKYRYVILIFAVGLLLMILPGKDTEDQQSHDVYLGEETTELSTAEELAQLLSSIEGAGKVRIMLTVAEGEETLYQTNESNSIGSGSENEKSDTVIITDSDRNETGLIRQINPPEYLGAVVVCQGADSPVVRLAIIDAVSKITGLGTDRISVLKMK